MRRPCRWLLANHPDDGFLLNPATGSLIPLYASFFLPPRRPKNAAEFAAFRAPLAAIGTQRAITSFCAAWQVPVLSRRQVSALQKPIPLNRSSIMLYWTIVFLVIALIAGALALA